MARFVDLEVLSGPEEGMRYTVESGTYRVLGRAGDDRDERCGRQRDRPRLALDDAGRPGHSSRTILTSWRRSSSPSPSHLSASVARW